MPQFYPTAIALSESESIELNATALKKRIYPEAEAIAECESILSDFGLNWFLDGWLDQIETDALCTVKPFIRYFPAGNSLNDTEINCASLAIWPEPPAPKATISCAGKDLHKQVLKSGSSHQINLAINFTETTATAVNLLQVIFEIQKAGNDEVNLRKTRFDTPGGVIVDVVKDDNNGKIILLADTQLRPNQILFSGKEAEFGFQLIVENSAISQRAVVSEGTIILSKD